MVPEFRLFDYLWLVRPTQSSEASNQDKTTVGGPLGFKATQRLHPLFSAKQYRSFTRLVIAAWLDRIATRFIEWHHRR